MELRGSPIKAELATEALGCKPEPGKCVDRAKVRFADAFHVA